MGEIENKYIEMEHIMKRVLTILLFSVLSLSASYKQGKEIFSKYCSKCHKGYIPADTIKDNFFNKDNKLLNLDAPTENMLAYAIMDGPKRVGDPTDKEMQQAEIEEYLKEYLYHPDPDSSICDNHVMKYYDIKKPFDINLSDEDFANLAQFFMEYKKERLKHTKAVIKVLSRDYDEKKILKDAKESKKAVIIEATSPTCYYCKKMKREVIDSKDIKDILSKNYILVEVNVDRSKLPFNLKKEYKHITPSFFFLSSSGEFIASYPGSWNKSDFKMILNEHKPKEGAK